MSSVPSNNNYFSEDVGMGIAAGMADSASPFARAMGRSMGTTLGNKVSRKEKEKELLRRKQEIDDQIERIKAQRAEDRANSMADMEQNRQWKTEDEASRRTWAEKQAEASHKREMDLEKMKLAGPDMSGINAGVISKGLNSDSNSKEEKARQEALRKMMEELMGPNVPRASGSPSGGFDQFSLPFED